MLLAKVRRAFKVWAADVGGRLRKHRTLGWQVGMRATYDDFKILPPGARSGWGCQACLCGFAFARRLAGSGGTELARLIKLR